MRLRTAITLVLLLQGFAADSECRLLRHRSRGPRAGTIALRRRLHVNPLITEPGTVEVEWNTAWTASGFGSTPTTLKWTPEGKHIFWGRTEFSANFDTIATMPVSGNRVWHTTDHVALTATVLVAEGEHWNFAAAPLVSFGLRDPQGNRAGVSAIVRYDRGRDSGGATLIWTGAPHASDTNPAGTWDLDTGYGHVFGDRVTLHADMLIERSTGVNRIWSIIEGAECQFTDNVALDVSAQHIDLAGMVDHQLVAGLTINFGHLFRRR